MKVAEVNRTLGKSLDSNFKSIYDGGSVKVGLANQWPTLLESTGGARPISEIVSDLTGTGLASLINSGNFSAAFFLQLAESQGQARILAEPNLTTLSGQEAEFLSGGTFWITPPANAITGGETIPVDFGVKLKFIPFVMDSGLINLKVNVSVSEPGPPTLSGGAENQSLLSRGANATVEVPSGQVISIAGLLSERARDAADKFPGLGDIPILGALFRSQQFQKEQSELVIFVTPRLANSYSPQEAKLPTANFVDPNDLDFYLMGKISGQRTSTSTGSKTASPYRQERTAGGGTEGPFGHDF